MHLTEKTVLKWQFNRLFRLKHRDYTEKRNCLTNKVLSLQLKTKTHVNVKENLLISARFHR